MLKGIVITMGLFIAPLKLYSKINGLFEIFINGDKSYPVEYQNSGNYTSGADFDFHKSSCYFRELSPYTQEPFESLVGGTTGVQRTYSMRFVGIVPKDVYGTDDPYIADKILSSTETAIGFDDAAPVLRKGFDAENVLINITTRSSNNRTTLDEEISGTGFVDIPYDKVFISIDFEVIIQGKLSCFTLCDCGDSDVNYLDLLQGIYCEVCADAAVKNQSGSFTQDINSGAIFTLPFQKVVDSDGSTVNNIDYLPASDGFAFTATPAADATVTNQAVTYSQAIASGATFPLPFQKIIDSDLSEFNTVDYKDISDGTLFTCTPLTPLYTRPSGWLPIPTIVPNEQVIYLLWAVYDDDSNYVAFDIQGDYDVNWGDGNSASFSAGVAEHRFDFADVGDLFNGYRQALITITPQVANDLTFVNFQQVHTVYGTDVRGVNMLDCVVSTPMLSGINLFWGFKAGETIVRFDICERFLLYQCGAITNVASLALNQIGVKQIILNDTSAITAFQSMAQGATNLIDSQIADTSSGITFASMYNGAENLRGVSDFDLSSCTSGFALVFISASCLQSFTATNTGGLTSLDRTFNGCHITALDFDDTSSISNWGQALRNSKIESLVGHDFSAATSFATICFTASNFREFNSLTTGSVTNIGSGFGSCFALKRFVMNATSVTSTVNAFTTNRSLQEILLNDLAVDVSVTNGILSAEAIDDFANSVKDLTALPSATVTLTGNEGTAGMNTSLWTDKNWVVVT